MSLCKILEAPPVGETMHSAGQCYCHLCSCGEHRCPYEERKSRYNPSSLKSIYRKDYPRKPLSRSEKCLPKTPLYTHEKRKDLISTSQHDFPPNESIKTKSAKYVRQSNLGALKFSGLTNYKSDFPNWGNYEFINIGNFKKSYVTHGVRLSPFTTYTQEFGNKIEAARFKSQSRVNARNPLPGKGEFFGYTTSGQTFVNFGKDKFPKRVKSKIDGIVKMMSPPKVYDTIYRSEFNKKESPQVFKKKRNMY